MFVRKNSFLFVPLIFLLLAVFLLPPQKTVHLKSNILLFFRTPLALIYRMQLSAGNAKKIFTFYSEYSAMQAEINNLKFKNNRLKEIELENARFRNILDLKEKSEHDYEVCMVIGKEPTNWLNSLIINKGRSEGIYINQPVMTFSGLVGKVIEVGNNTAKVLLISDVNSRVVVFVQRTRIEGMLEGVGKGLCRLKYLPVNADVELGDMVVSAGLGGVYPKGLVIGRIESVKIERGGIYKSCIVKPESSLSGLEEVLCLKLNSGQ